MQECNFVSIPKNNKKYAFLHRFNFLKRLGLSFLSSCTAQLCSCRVRAMQRVRVRAAQHFRTPGCCTRRCTHKARRGPALGYGHHSAPTATLPHHLGLPLQQCTPKTCRDSYRWTVQNRNFEGQLNGSDR